jgi:hypothetical protein
LHARHFGDTTDITPVDAVDSIGVVVKHVHCAVVTFIPKDYVIVTLVLEMANG